MAAEFNGFDVYYVVPCIGKTAEVEIYQYFEIFDRPAIGSPDHCAKFYSLNEAIEWASDRTSAPGRVFVHGKWTHGQYCWKQY